MSLSQREVAEVVDGAVRAVSEHTERVLGMLVLAGFAPGVITEQVGYPMGTEEHPRVVSDANGQTLARLWCRWDGFVLTPCSAFEPEVEKAIIAWLLRGLAK